MRLHVSAGAPTSTPSIVVVTSSSWTAVVVSTCISSTAAVADVLASASNDDVDSGSDAVRGKRLVSTCTAKGACSRTRKLNNKDDKYNEKQTWLIVTCILKITAKIKHATRFWLISFRFAPLQIAVLCGYKYRNCDSSRV